jgi:hypothetical protein
MKTTTKQTKKQQLRVLAIAFFLGISLPISAQTDTTIRTRTRESHDTTVIMRSKDTVVRGKAPAPAPVEDDDDNFYQGEIGLRFLPTFTSLEFQTVDEGTVKGEVTLGYGISGMLAGNFTRHAGIQLEIIYNSLTQKYKDRDLDRRIDISYINFPLLLSLNSDKAKPVNFNFVAGPQIGYNIGSRVETSSGGSDGADTVQAVLAIRKGDFGFAYGAGLEFKLNQEGNFRFDIGFRGVYGLVNINDNSGTRTTNSYYILEKSRLKTNSLYLGFAYLF